MRQTGSIQWRVEERQVDVGVRRPVLVPNHVLVGDDGTEAELKLTGFIDWRFYLRREDVNVRFSVGYASDSSCVSDSNSLSEPPGPRELGPVCHAVLDAKYGLLPVDASSKELVIARLKDALKNAWRLPHAPQIRVVSVEFWHDLKQFSDI